jgi:DNA-binding FadR family transcriptional regulator
MRIEAAAPDVRVGEYESHRALYDAVLSGDPARARAAMRKHLEVVHGLEERVSLLERKADEKQLTPAIDTQIPHG